MNIIELDPPHQHANTGPGSFQGAPFLCSIDHTPDLAWGLYPVTGRYRRLRQIAPGYLLQDYLELEASVLSNFCCFCPIPLLWKLELIDFLTLESLQVQKGFRLKQPRNFHHETLGLLNVPRACRDTDMYSNSFGQVACFSMVHVAWSSASVIFTSLQ